MDEASKELRADVRSLLPMEPGKPERIDDHYERQGTANLFLACELLHVWRQITVTERRTKVDRAHFVRELVDVRYPEAERIVLVMDNRNTHRPACLYEAFSARRGEANLRPAGTALHAQARQLAQSRRGGTQCDFRVLRRQCTDRRFPDAQALNAAVAAWQTARNADTATVNWRFTTQDARIRLMHLHPTLHD